jgi:hypothetical protein
LKNLQSQSQRQYLRFRWRAHPSHGSANWSRSPSSRQLRSSQSPWTRLRWRG